MLRKTDINPDSYISRERTGSLYDYYCLRKTMKRDSRVVFHWTSKNGKKHTLETTGEYFKNYAIELMEDEQLDKVFNAHYTIDNTVTKRLDYYNEELS